MDVTIIVNKLLTLSIMAVALGMGAFSIGLGMGADQLRLKRIAKIGIVFGLFNLFMPLLGMALGRLLSGFLGEIATMTGVVLLLFLGGHMTFSSFRDDDGPVVNPTGLGLILMAFTVSIDTFSVGLSLGFYGTRVIAAILLFGGTTMALTWLGFFIGHRFQNWLGKYGEALGGCALFVLGLKLLFSL